MWILESSSELFQGRRMWLKPGKSYLFGRVKKDGVRFAIDNKTISRKHFIIRIDDVQIEDVGNIHARTKLFIEDQGSKAGTTVNGDFIRDESRELKDADNYIKPGSLPEDLSIRWLPCVLTYNLLKKEIKAGVLQSKQARLRDLDIKVVSEYVAGQTTHLVVNKRNTPKSLQALIDARPLVAESYIDALEYATTPSDLNEEENLSPLEQDYDNAWPIPFEHLPPPGRELTTRPSESYKPYPKRRNVFRHITFVFLDQNQYDNLLPPITAGHGKALICKITPNETTPSEIITFMQNAAGSKGFGEVDKDIDRGGVILVRYKGDVGHEDWTNDLVNQVALKLDQRAIDQGEFLEAILANNGLSLRQAVPFESNVESVDHPAAVTTVSEDPHSSTNGAVQQPESPILSDSINTHASHSDSQPVLNARTSQNGGRTDSPATNSGLSQPPADRGEDSLTRTTKRTRFTMPQKSKVLDFDDDFDPNSVPPYQDEDDDQALAASLSQTPQQQMSSGLPQAGNSLNGIKDDLTSSRKRPRPSPGDQNTGFDEEMDDLLPAAAAMKRRKLTMAAENGDTVSKLKSGDLPAQSKKLKSENEIDVRGIARAQREAEEQKAREQDEMDEEIHLEPGQKLPVYDVETVLVDLPIRKPSSVEAHSHSTDSWDPKWNGRKNFKGFRRAQHQLDGEDNTAHRRRNHNKVIVPMVDAKLATYGIGDQYWDKTQEEKERDREKKKRMSQRATQSESGQSRTSHHHRSQTIPEDDESDRDQGSDNEVNGQTSPEVSRLQNDTAELLDHELDVNEPRKTRSADTQTTTQLSNGKGRGTKRIVGNSGPTTASKKQKMLPVTVIHASDSDDSDDMKFKFGSHSRRGRGKA